MNPVILPGADEPRPCSAGRRRVEDDAEAAVAAAPLAAPAVVPEQWLKVPPGPVTLSAFDIAAKLQLSDGGLAVQGYKGYRTVRASHGVCAGTWYFEMRVRSKSERGAVRVGWSTRRADASAPVGFHRHTFSLRDRTGEFVTNAGCEPYGSPFGVGDVIGCLISLPAANENQRAKIAAADRAFLDFRFIRGGQGKAPDDAGFTFDRAYVTFSKNGKSFGIPNYFYKSVAAKGRGNAPDKGIRACTYYPAVALFKEAVAEANFGPNFAYAMPEDARAFCEVAPVADPVKEEKSPTPKQVEPEALSADKTGSKEEDPSETSTAPTVGA